MAQTKKRKKTKFKVEKKKAFRKTKKASKQKARFAFKAKKKGGKHLRAQPKKFAFKPGARSKNNPEQKLNEIVQNIRALKIQGAEKVLDAVIEASEMSIKMITAPHSQEFKKLAKQKIMELAKLRPTEPGVRNFARFFLMRLFAWPEENVEALRKKSIQTIENYFAHKKELKKQLVELGARKIENGMTILTHCHSNSLESVLLEAKKQGKKFKVICTETRPLFQGRIMAERLANAGIPVTLMVDSAVASLARQIDLFLSGSDAILADGSLVNKIGTKQISMICHSHQIPHLVVSLTHKFDSITLLGFDEAIEERDAGEVWPNHPKHVKILNQAFDVTPADLITAYITEKGVLAPQMLPFVVLREMELNKNKEEVSLIKELAGKK